MSSCGRVYLKHLIRTTYICMQTLKHSLVSYRPYFAAPSLRSQSINQLYSVYILYRIYQCIQNMYNTLLNVYSNVFQCISLYFYLFNRRFPCVDMFLKKAVKGGRLAVHDWHYDLTNATAYVQGLDFLPMKVRALCASLHL